MIACTTDDRRELQKCQNEALRICSQVRMMDYVRIDNLQARCKIVSLEQRRRLLLLMYKKSKDVMLHKILQRILEEVRESS